MRTGEGLNVESVQVHAIGADQDFVAVTQLRCPNTLTVDVGARRRVLVGEDPVVSLSREPCVNAVDLRVLNLQVVLWPAADRHLVALRRER